MTDIDYLQQGEPARLFPVLSTTSKEGRTTSILMACMSKVDEFGRHLLGSVGQKLGKRAKVETYTEVVFKGQKSDVNDRPDALIIVTIGSRQWRALVEAKVGTNQLELDQIERYRQLAKDQNIDCVITISNQFTTNPLNHPLHEIRKNRSKIPVYHWSWMYILTTTDLLLNNDDVEDVDQALLLNELRRFLSHDSAGVRGFERMPSEWTEINRLISAGGNIPAKSSEAHIVMEAWHQELRDLALILSRKTDAAVMEKLPRKHLNDPNERVKDEIKVLREQKQMSATLEIPHAAAPLDITVDLARRAVDVGMTIKAPEDRKSSTARLNWLLRQVKTSDIGELHIRCYWPRRSETTQFSFEEIRDDASKIEHENKNLQASAFHIYFTKKLGGRFTQQSNFIIDLEEIVPRFYQEIGQNLNNWQKPAPRIREVAEKAAASEGEADTDETGDET